MGNEFSELAIQKLLQLFPELSSLIVNFKDITDEVSTFEDTDTSVGVFILQSGERHYYLPIVSKGDAIQPLDSVFDNTEQCFIPLTKGFVNILINSSQNSLGKATKIPDTVNQNPSIYSLVTPPRTGKFVYASSSKLEEFLTLLPNQTKEAVLTKISSDKEVYDALHKLFGLENLFSALKPTINPIVVQSKPAMEVITEGNNLSEVAIQDILNKGYSITGTQASTRIAIPANDFSAMGKLRQLSVIDAGQDFDVCFKTGETISATLVKRSKYLPQTPALLRSNPNKDKPIAIFADGRFSIRDGLVAVGEGRDGKSSLKQWMDFSGVITPNELTNQDSCFAILSPELDLIDVYSYPTVTRTQFGTSISARSRITDSKVDINAFVNCHTINCQDASNVFIPANTSIVKLTGEVSSGKLEVNINSAAARLELTTLTALGSALNIGFDGIEFTVNRVPVGGEPAIMKALVLNDGISPEKAESFVKQARETKHVKIYLSKKADEDSSIPTYGTTPAPQQTGGGINGDFSNNLTQASQTNDAEVVESTIIGELLQVQDMKGYIREYLPEIKNSIDKLGRSLFLCRLKMDQLAVDHNASEVLSFIANIRNTYRMLGDSYLKLSNMIAESEVSPDEK